MSKRHAWLRKEIRNMEVGEFKTWPVNWPGVDDALVAEVQAFLDTLTDKRFTASKANFDRNHWLSLGVERIA